MVHQHVKVGGGSGDASNISKPAQLCIYFYNYMFQLDRLTSATYLKKRVLIGNLGKCTANLGLAALVRPNCMQKT